ncbi:altered inheritance of mitochondria protein 32-like isoform X2 [Andrographis paniculata]|uniref:altered inheritance of mitochondria protein 32-like isoform X2 n=1 Tax=Andrographis paniculata TaxID=175694 RepID=UPI0021E971C7|nr:altered inheritance of mitochondria protein 32-like isoform X2 [Andrographis paniculata]
MRIRCPRAGTAICISLFSFSYSTNHLRNFSARSSSFLLHFTPQPLRRSTMAGESDDIVTKEKMIAQYGFDRDEMYQSKLAGTVDPYDRHVFLCYGSAESWPPRLEDSVDDSFPRLFAAALKARKDEIKLKTRMTIFEEYREANLSSGDILIFPDMVIYRGVQDSEIDSLVEDVLVKELPWHRSAEQLDGSYVFVCAHSKRDNRCGVCGPILVEKFREIGNKELGEEVTVAACSHVGGHKYAGNVIIFSAGRDGKVDGNWYGYVTPNDVPDLIKKQIVNGQIIDRIWRGGMTQNAKEPENGKVSELAANGTCCQGSNSGFRCCQENNGEKEKAGLSSWTAKLEQRRVLTTVGLVTAVAAVAVAYGFYRKAR